MSDQRLENKERAHRSSEHFDGEGDLLNTLADNTEAAMRISGVVVGKIVGVDQNGAPLVDFSCNVFGRPLPATSTLALAPSHAGRSVALMFEGERADRPIVMGLMHQPVAHGEEENRKTITAERELLLICGQSSILLKEDGKIVIKGRDILSRARRNNKIRGGSVQLN